MESSSCVRILGRFVCRIEHANKPTISQHVRAEASPLINSLSPTSHTNFALWVASYPAQLGGVIMEPKTLAADWRQRQIKITAAASSRWTSDRYAGRLKDGRTDR